MRCGGTSSGSIFRFLFAAPSARIAILPPACIRPASTSVTVDRLIEDLSASPDWAANLQVELPAQVDTIYLGGGTPSLLAPELLERLFSACRSEFDVDRDAEITVESAPGQIADETLGAFQSVVSRASA